ncbi:MAG: nuclear transport factor 2 family protein [Chitinophagaceae bacterium]
MKTTAVQSLFLTLIVSLVSCTASKNNKIEGLVPYKPASQELHDTIVRLDSLLFQSYNTCDLDKYSAFFSDTDFEFYHDGGGLDTSKKNSIEGVRKNVCGKVTRELLKGSIEVSPVPGFGAIEIGMHRFHNNQEPGVFSKYARFVIVWKKEKDDWKITRVISLH